MVNKFYLSFFIFISIFVIGSYPVYSEKIALDSISIPKDIDNIYVHKISSDMNSTDFLIVIKKSVPLHMHAIHTETIYVLDGEGEFQRNNERFMIKRGDYLRIEKGTPHAVKVTSIKPLKVLSVQAPEFFGKDRIFLPEEE
jgi:mannose-6-phosphate isomerase-like protein (cupin superfamily)